MPILPDIALQGITKRFPGGHLALDSVSLTFRPGQLHAVVGENGAGKSTLMNILFGLHQPDTGDILVDGKRRVHRSPAVAIAGGVGMVHQHFKLVPSFTVLENIRLAARPGLRHRLRRARDIMALGERYGISVPPDTLIAALPLAVQQRVEILKALANEAALLILDEPTTILNPQEAETLYSTLRRIAADGRSVAVVTHHLDEVLTHSDQVSVLRHGRLVSTGPTAGTTRAQLIHDIIGRRGEFGHSLVTHRNRGAEALRLQAVSVPPTAASAGLQAVDLTLHHGEVLAVAGVEGNGQRELFDILAGLRTPASGTLTGAGAGRAIGLVPEDRHAEGLVLDLSVSLNLLLSKLDDRRFSRFGRLNHPGIAAEAASLAERFDIRTRHVSAAARDLSGGNQQKIVLARAMESGAGVLVVYQPTRGLDVAAAEEVLKRLRLAAEDGAAVLLISSNLEEILRVSDRILVFYGGAVAGEVDAETASQATLGALMTGAAL